MTALEKFAYGFNLYKNEHSVRFQREGQKLMNYLYMVHEHLYDEIAATDSDCFYDDLKIPAFWEVVTNHLENE